MICHELPSNSWQIMQVFVDQNRQGQDFEKTMVAKDGGLRQVVGA
jgi:hypothetical protein